MQHSPKVLLLSTDQAETADLLQALGRHAILTPASDLFEAKLLLQNENYDALFCAWSFQTGTWLDAVAEVRKWQPDLPVIVLSRTAEEREWLQVLEAGAFDLLVPPFNAETLLAVLEQAAASREVWVIRGLRPRLKASA